MLNSKIQKKPNTNKNSQKEFYQMGLHPLAQNSKEALESMKNIISHDSMNFYNHGLVDTQFNCFARVK